MTTMTASPLAALEPVSLADMVSRAEMLTRVDRKYVVSVEAALALIEAMPAGIRVLEIDGRREFSYHSIYLDTAGFTSFLVSGRSHRRRWKVRTRSYLDTGGTWLEIKTRAARGRTVKRRIEHPDVLSFRGLTDSGRQFVSGIVGEAITNDLRPVITTGYRRSTFLLSGSTGRVTVDVDLSWNSLTGTGKLRRPSLAIIETKTGSTPSVVDRMLWSRGYRPVRISKFGVGMAALNPDLPHLKWHRSVHTHLGIPRLPSTAHLSRNTR